MKFESKKAAGVAVVNASDAVSAAGAEYSRAVHAATDIVDAAVKAYPADDLLVVKALVDNVYESERACMEMKKLSGAFGTNARVYCAFLENYGETK
jgi:hypothetical protein